MRNMLCLQEEEVERLTACPILSQTFRPRATYHRQPIAWGRCTLHLPCSVKDAYRYMLRLRCASPATEAKLDGKQQETKEDQCEWEGRWGKGEHSTPLILPSLLCEGGYHKHFASYTGRAGWHTYESCKNRRALQGET